MHLRSKEARLAFAAVLLFSVGACGKKQTGAPRTNERPPPDVVSVIGPGFGAEPGRLGADLREEGSPEGPKSFVVDAAGRIHVLDQVNHRIQTFEAGSPAGTLALPDRPFEDIELDSGGFLLLDRFESPAVVGLGKDGVVSGELPLPSEEVPEAGLVTSLVRNESGIWLGLEDEYLMQIGDAAAAPVEPQVVPGQLIDAGEVFRATLDGATRVALFRQSGTDAAPEELATIELSRAIRETSLVARGPSGGLWVVLLVEEEQSDPDIAPAQEHVLVQLSESGSEIARHTLPASESALEAFRSVRHGADGNIYVMKTTESGTEFLKVTP